MRGFLKCFYGFGNLGDELLFWGVLDYIDTAYSEVQSLTVEVENVEWMEQRWTKNVDMMISLSLATGFVLQKKIIKFVPISKSLADNFSYDMYFFGGGEVFAESRGFHGGWNYLLRYLYPIIRGKFVLLGGIETATKWRQKFLYRIVLPRAQRVVSRDHVSFEETKSYTSNVIHHHDFAIPVIDRYRQQTNGTTFSGFQVQKPYVIINLVASVNTEDVYDKIKKFLTVDYPDAIPVYISGKSIDSDDTRFARWLQGVYPSMIIFDRQAYPLTELFALIDGASAGIAARLHILLLLQEFDKPRHALVYAQKVQKLITSTLEL